MVLFRFRYDVLRIHLLEDFESIFNSRSRILEESQVAGVSYVSRSSSTIVMGMVDLMMTSSILMLICWPTSRAILSSLIRNSLSHLCNPSGYLIILKGSGVLPKTISLSSIIYRPSYQALTFPVTARVDLSMKEMQRSTLSIEEQRQRYNLWRDGRLLSSEAARGSRHTLNHIKDTTLRDVGNGQRTHTLDCSLSDHWNLLGILLGCLNRFIGWIE